MNKARLIGHPDLLKTVEQLFEEVLHYTLWRAARRRANITHTLGALMLTGIKTVPELLSYTEEEIRKLNDIGEGRLDLIKRVLEQRGLKLGDLADEKNNVRRYQFDENHTLTTKKPEEIESFLREKYHLHEGTTVIALSHEEIEAAGSDPQAAATATRTDAFRNAVLALMAEHAPASDPALHGNHTLLEDAAKFLAGHNAKTFLIEWAKDETCLVAELLTYDDIELYSLTGSPALVAELRIILSKATLQPAILATDFYQRNLRPGLAHHSINGVKQFIQRHFHIPEDPRPAPSTPSNG